MCKSAVSCQSLQRYLLERRSGSFNTAIDTSSKDFLFLSIYIPELYDLPIFSKQMTLLLLAHLSFLHLCLLTVLPCCKLIYRPCRAILRFHFHPTPAFFFCGSTYLCALREKWGVSSLTKCVILTSTTAAIPICPFTSRHCSRYDQLLLIQSERGQS